MTTPSRHPQSPDTDCQRVINELQQEFGNRYRKFNEQTRRSPQEEIEFIGHYAREKGVRYDHARDADPAVRVQHELQNLQTAITQQGCGYY